MKTRLQYTCLGLIFILLNGCRKDFLNERPNKALLVPETLTDFRALLDNNNLFNNTPALPSIADGDTYTTDAGFNAYAIDQERNSYTWSADIFGVSPAADWNLPYQQIFYANIVLEGLENLPAGQKQGSEYAEQKGTALFHRGFAFYQLSQQFMPPYNEATAAADKGLPLKLSSDVNQLMPRSSVAATYSQIIRDLKGARTLLPLTTTVKSRPTLAAAFAALSKVYLVMAQYAQAGKYADSCLQLQSSIINYNTLSTTAARPFPRALPSGNPEVIFYAVATSYTFTSSASPTVADPALYQSYAANDLRKSIFFRALSPGYKFKGNYAGILVLFSGLATDEQYLIRAECNARLNNTAAAIRDMNALLLQRWKTGTFFPYSAGSPSEALSLILSERRKELTGRGTRWSDLRRLNSDPVFATTLSRTILGKTYTLEPGSKRYTYPIPAEEIRLNNLEQNER